MHGWGSIRAGKIFSLFISNEDMNDIIRTINLLEKSLVLIDGVTETVKQIKKTRWISCSFASTYGCFNDSTCGYFICKKVSSGKGVMRAGRGVRRTTRGYNKDHLDKMFYFCSSL